MFYEYALEPAVVSNWERARSSWTPSPLGKVDSLRHTPRTGSGGYTTGYVALMSRRRASRIGSHDSTSGSLRRARVRHSIRRSPGQTTRWRRTNARRFALSSLPTRSYAAAMS